MSDNNGWIKLHRQLLEWEWYGDINVRILFIHCLLKANHQDNKWRGVLVKKGTFVSSYGKLSKQTGLTVKQIRTSIDKLKRTNEMAVKSNTLHTVFELVKYVEYQSNGKQEGTPKADEGQTEGERGATNKKDKNVKNDNILLKDISSPPDGVDILHFYIAKGFYNLFLLKGKTRTLAKAKVVHWVKIIRLLINEDNVTIEQLVAIKYYFEKCQQRDRGVKTWWFENINSVAAFRKKNKDNEYHYDKITIDIKKWVEASPDIQAEIFTRTKKLKEKTL